MDLNLIRDSLRVFSNSGLLNPSFLFHSARAVAKHGGSLGTGIAAAATRTPDGIALVDEAGKLTFAEVHRRTNSIARGLTRAGVECGDGVGILCRNDRSFFEATIAVSKLGADTLFLNTGFAAPQLADVLEREGVATIIYDEDFAPIVEQGAGDRLRVLGWSESVPTSLCLEWLIARNSDADIDKPPRVGAMTILTSGTTGTPKGARRSSSESPSREVMVGMFETIIGTMEKMPIRTGEVAVVCAPTFHSWGLMHALMSTFFGSTVVLRRRFDPEATLAMIEENRGTVLAVVPVMMQRILELGEDVIRKYDTSSLHLVAASGSALPGALAKRWMDMFGDTLVNFYGSTEAAQVSIATPEDLRAAPGTAGRPPRGTVVKLLDEKGFEVAEGSVGRIFVGNAAQFEGYTGGGNKEFIDGLMSIGDVGYFDDEGRLFVGGRDDDMIISGGENVFPREIEDLLADHPAISEAAVIGVADEEFGQRLKAFVVLRQGQTLEAAEVRDHIKQHLARYKVPREVVFMDALPRNATGKVLKRELR